MITLLDANRMEQWGGISSFNLSPVLWLTVLGEPHLTVTFPSKEEIQETNEVTLVCLVTGEKPLTNYNITWTESKAQQRTPPQRVSSWTNQDGKIFMVTSVYRTTKEKWDSHTMFECTFQSGRATALGTVSKPEGNSLECPPCQYWTASVWSLVQTCCLLCGCSPPLTCVKPSASIVQRVGVVLPLNVSLSRCLTPCSVCCFQ